MRRFLIVVLLGFLVCISTKYSFAQKNTISYLNNLGQLKYSSLDFWYSRKVKESRFLSGKTIDLFGVGKIGPNADRFDYTLKDHSSPWGTTNIYSKMVLDIGNTRVIPEKRDNGYCCRLETKIRKDKIVGINVEVLIAGTLFLGEMIEPVKSMKDPIKNVSQGVPFDKKPDALKFDYKYSVGENRVQATNSANPTEGGDKAEFCLILQKRWEDEDGNVFATRIGGARQFYEGKVDDWVNESIHPITYGDLTALPNYDAKFMGLIPEVSEVYVKNSKDEMVPLVETGWGKSDDMPTHLILYFTSSYEGVEYKGSTETVFWVDNIEFIYY